jgi:CysZ protein
MPSAAALALRDVFSPEFRTIFWKSLGLTILLLVLLWLIIEFGVAWFIDLAAYPWLDLAINILTGIGALVFLAFLVAPATSLFAAFFADEIAALTEQHHYPADPPGQPVPFFEAIRDALAFTGLTLIVNLAALALLLVPGVNLVAFFVGNGYLLGREYFEAAARRHLGREPARALRRENTLKVFFGGLLVAAFLAVPILNLLTPLFATAFMTHLYKRSARARL